MKTSYVYSILFFVMAMPIIVHGKDYNYDNLGSISLVELFDSGTLPHPYIIRSSPDETPFIITDGICINWDDINSSTFAFPADFPLNDVYWDKRGNCLYSDNENIYFFNANQQSSILLLKSNMSHLNFRLGASAIYYYQTDDSCLYSCSMNDLRTNLLYKFGDKIYDVKIKGDDCIIAYGKKLGILSKKEFTQLVYCSMPINSVETLGGAYFYGTDNGLYCSDGLYNYLVYKKGVKNLDIINDELFITFGNYDAAKIVNLSLYVAQLLSTGTQIHFFDNETINGKILIDAGEISISPNQLCVIPNNGIYLLTGNELISLEENETLPIIRISEQIIPEKMLFSGTNVFAKNDTTIVSCREELTPLCVFDTNQFEMFLTTDNNLFVMTKNDSISMIFSCDAANGKVEPFIKIAEDVIYVAGDTRQCILVTSNRIYSIQENRVGTLLDYFEPIETATLTNSGLIFSTANNILLLNGKNNVSLIAERGCRRLFSDVDKLYIYYDDGTVLLYNMDLLKNN